MDLIALILARLYCLVCWVISTPESVASMIGAFLAAIIAYYSIYRTEKNHRIREDAKEQQDIRAFLEGIKTELTSIFGRYDDNMGKYIKDLPEGQPFDAKVTIGQDYFSFYHTNNGFLGRLKDAALRSHIIDCYIQSKGMIDSLNMNNHMIFKMEEHKLLYENTNSSPHYNNYKSYENGLVVYATELQNQDAKMRLIIPAVIQRITNTLSNSDRV